MAHDRSGDIAESRDFYEPNVNDTVPAGAPDAIQREVLG